MMRVSTTSIEQYRRLMTYDYVDEAQLIASVKREGFVPTWQMQVGSAWDAVLTDTGKHRKSEYRSDGEPDVWYESGGYKFDGKHVDAGLEAMGDGVCQVKAVRSFDTSFGPVDVVAKADHVVGLTVTDNKAKFSQPDASDYEQDLQWRFYLLVHGAECFRYLLYDFFEPKEGFVGLKDIVSFRFWNYSGIESTCHAWLERFLAWADSRGILESLRIS